MYENFFRGESSKFYIKAMEDSNILVTDYNSWRKLLEENFCWNILAKRVVDRAYILKEKRESRLLLEDAKTRYIKFLEQYPRLKDRVKQYHIASYLGISPVTLSRINSKLDID
ncbi:MAG: Crp/Fnr family transcriptional regulator [Halothermotrichaceae bacterium]